MLIGGLEKVSLIDYPGRVSCVIFLSGCNFRCPYCHNPQLVRGPLSRKSHLTESEIYEFLEKRLGLLEGVVISGGEPTIQDDLAFLCGTIKKMGYPVKLDTNGSRPEVVARLIEKGLVDYIAMDIKTGPYGYAPVISSYCIAERILLSLRIVMESGVPYEFRTTCVKPMVDHKVVESIARIIEGAKRYVLQCFHNGKVLDPGFFRNGGSGCSEEELRILRSTAEPYVQEVLIR